MSADTGLTPVPSRGGRHRARRRVELPASVMRCITALTGDATLSPGERLTGAIMLTFGWAWYDRQESIDPTALALPRHQWLEVCEQLAHGVPGDAIGGVNLGLSFMDRGPSVCDV